MINLETELAKINGIGPKFLARLYKLKIRTVKNLLWHFPFRYDDFSKVIPISELAANQPATIHGTIKKVSIRRSWQKRMSIIEAIIADETGGIRAVWFNQPYLAQILKSGVQANFAGKISLSNSRNEIYLSNPTYEITSNPGTSSAMSGPKHTAGLIPVYPETKGLTSKGIRFILKPLLKYLEPIQEFLPAEILRKNSFPEINIAIKKIHFPLMIEEADAAKKRFAFEDLFLLQINNLKNKSRLALEKAVAISADPKYLDELLQKLPFALTASQNQSLNEIISDIKNPRPMNRLLQGDVGSGKTVIAALAAMMTVKNGFQAAFLAPTEVLAQQHYRTLINIFKEIETETCLLTGTTTKKKEISKDIAAGNFKIIIGTHAIIQKGIKFKNLALIVIDEQHRFGVSQRAALSTQITADKNAQINAVSEENFLYKDLTFKLRGIIFKVFNNLGSGFKENIYQKALEEELNNSGLSFEKEKNIDVKYNGKKIGVYRPDFIIENKIILEIKALPFTGAVEKKQIWHYLKGSNYKLALLINFGSKNVDIQRIIYDTARNLHESALVMQKSALRPHFLSMSATPIPRTLSLTVFGDLDLSTINELPANRKPIITKVVEPENRNKAYGFIKEQIKKGRQAFVICPRIEPGQKEEGQILTEAQQKLLELKSVKEEFEKLSKKVFPDLKVVMLHGKIKGKEKDKIMKDFADKKFDILVSTSVIEVGVDIPNSTIMMIEGADRFGLAQLYQFRGRVGRGQHQSFCLLFTDSNSGTVKQRLNSLLTAKNGFELAEKDLALRGPGQFMGETQTGLPDIAMRALQNMELVKSARAAAEETLANDPELKNHPILAERFNAFKKDIHME